MSYPIETAVQHDELTETVSYADVYDTTKEFLEGHQFNLIESAANGLLKTLQTQYPALGQLRCEFASMRCQLPASLSLITLKLR